MAFIYSLLLTLFGLMFQFDIFKKNDFGVLFLTFWLFEQSMIGLAFMLGAFLRRAEQAVTVGFALFLIAFIFFFVITFGFPYGAYKKTAPFSYQYDITTKQYVLKDSKGDRAAEPLFSLLPPNLLSKNIADLGALTATDKNNGIRFSEAYSYCTINPDLCNPPYSVGNSWSWYIGMYFVYSLIGLYLENVLPDAMGVKKAPWYLFTPAYWGLSTAHITDDPDAVIEASKDEDVLSEESTAKTRANQDMDGANAIEIRGLTQTFKRGGKPFHAVKAPWYVVKKNQLFALLGPNGAGKTTTINMLTGFLPPTAGNALVFGNTVAHPSGMNRVKRVIGICPQFDILWERLTAREHLIIFAIIKGIKPDSVYHEADKRIEEVRLNDAANQIAGSFSGGMKRRLSVAVSLIGNPSVVYLDEPTTGMDPINRRHVWDVIEAAKQDRCVVLTTHSMEEADILGDRIGIMAKGRLRCIGSSVRLKSRFGGGYRISVSCGDKMTPNSPQSLRVKEMFRESLRVEVSEESKTYLHFNVPTADSSALQSFFELLEGKKQELSIVDVQLSMSTLEDVFLNIAKQSEKEEAMLLNKTVNVTLRNGEVVGVLLGNEEELVSPNGVKFTVKWGADENGNLIVVDTKESNVTQKSIVVTVPEGVGAGELVQVEVEGQTFNVTVPENAPPGTTFNATAYVEPKNTNASLFSDSTMIKISEEEVQERVTKLHTSFGQQAGASFSKNLSLQSRKWLTNCCLVLIPIFFIIIILMLQFLLEILFLGQPTVRCPYCGPANDTFAKSYCNGASSCADYFFPVGKTQDLTYQYNLQCKKVSETCGGNGNDACFQPQLATASQFAFCPITFGIKQPNLAYNTPKYYRSKTPVLYTQNDRTNAFASSVADKVISSLDDFSDKLKATAKVKTQTLYTLLLTPMLGCGGLGGVDQTFKSQMCGVIQAGEGTSEPCCADFSLANETSLHANTSQGVKFASGKGMASLYGLLYSMLGASLQPLLQGTQMTYPEYFQTYVASKITPRFECVEPTYSSSLQAEMQSNPCVKMQEAVSLAATASSDRTIYPKLSAMTSNLTKDCKLDQFKNLSAVVTLLTTSPCTCKWLFLAQTAMQNFSFFADRNLAGIEMEVPKTYNCAAKDGAYQCSNSNLQGFFNIPEMRFSTSIWAGSTFFNEQALNPQSNYWDILNSRDTPYWKNWGKNGHGFFSLLTQSCGSTASQSHEMCYINRTAALQGIYLQCIDSKPTWVDSKAAIDQMLYRGYYDKYGSNGSMGEQYVNAFDFLNTDGSNLNVSVMYNDTTQWASPTGQPKSALRIMAPISNVFDAFVNVKLGGSGYKYALSALGIKEMPQPAWKLNLDLASSLGPFFFTLAFSLLFPTIIVSIVYEKEMKLRVIMRMMGLGNAPYWFINYIFWFIIYALFIFMLLLVASLARLPSGYTIGLFTKQEPSVHFVFFLLFFNNTIAFAFLWTTLLRSARTSSIAATLYVLGFSLIAWLCWGVGNFFNSTSVSKDLVNFITLFPLWSLYRGFNEYYQYAYVAARSGGQGLTWSKMATDPRCGMPAVLAILAVEWVVFMLITIYLDQVLDSGHGVPKHPLFFLGYKHREEQMLADIEHEQDISEFPDVQEEEARINKLESADKSEHDAVMIHQLKKIYPGYLGGSPKVAVKSLTMGVQHGECFGMLGPNGAGKTTTINMLIGFTRPSGGHATVEVFSIISEMNRIYSLMGVCPQHDILWETLTAREHMTFYGRLKNLRGDDLKHAITYGLQQVNLLHVIDEKAGTFSGGMKRRLSVAISMIGNPLICYLDEPSTGLDPASRRTLWSCIKEAKKTRAIFLTTHSMEEAEGLCDRLGIFVDGQLRCIGNPKELTSRFGGFYVLSVTAEPGMEQQVFELIKTMPSEVRVTYALAGTQKFEIPSNAVTLATVFRIMSENKQKLKIIDWGIANTTLEEAFIKISKNAAMT
uniref:ABC transporter domain-containing protein n=1 Tax=Guillardia theta TaxID=55529 RepID=A0A7S4NY30_GUITH